MVENVSGGLVMSKNKVEVTIGGNVYAVRGEESKEHIQKVAKLINKHLADSRKYGSMEGLSDLQIHMSTTLQIADSYIKLQESFEQYAKELEKCNHENILLKERIQELSLEISEIRVSKHIK